MCSQAIDQNDVIFGNGKNSLVYCLTTHQITVYYYLMKYSIYLYLNIPKESNIVIFCCRCQFHEMLVFVSGQTQKCGIPGYSHIQKVEYSQEIHGTTRNSGILLLTTGYIVQFTIEMCSVTNGIQANMRNTWFLARKGK